MTEISSSQESLPLSQETFASIWSGIPANIQELSSLGNIPLISTDENSSGMNSLEQLGAAMSAIQIPYLERNSQQSSVPATENFPGIFNFAVSVPYQKDLSKNPPIAYSTLNRRLYVQKDIPCPFNFSTNQPSMGNNYEIRAMVYFSSPENVSEIVVRCINHSHKVKESGDILYEHFIKCSSQASMYFRDDVTKRHSVTVPYEDPPIGQNYSTYLFNFTCFTSCSGGPNRRPMCVVFTLENRGLIVGRCKVDLKVCSNPYRDRTAEEKYIMERNSNDAPVLANPRPPKRESLKRKREANKSDEFIIRVKDEECYKLLRTVKVYYEIHKSMRLKNNWVSTVKDVASILQVLTSSDEDKEV